MDWVIRSQESGRVNEMYDRIVWESGLDGWLKTLGF